MKLHGRVALITGAGSGIGRASAVVFAREGAKVVLAGRREEPLRRAVEAIRAEGGEAIHQPTDVTQSSQVEALVRAALAAFGKLDIVFCNAGINPYRTNILHTTEAHWQEVLATNLTGVFLTCKHSLPALIENHGGSIVVTSSQVGLVGQKDRLTYGTTKGALINFVRCMALDCAPFNVRVNAVCPGRVQTELTAERPDWKERSALYPLGFRGTPDDVARAAVYLASDDAQWVTGVALPVDGGFVLA
jgi:meso-butanediol dehydrogenase / (S,S)-butanediol dehydrogenase / diacetyl reductase